MKLGSPATGSDFFGRALVLEDLWRYLLDDHLKFPGVRRLGKTSILKRLLEEAPDHGVLAEWLDVSNVDSAESFVALLDRAFPEKTITRFLSDRAQQVKDWFKRLRKIEATLPDAVGGGGLGVELDGDAAPAWLEKAETVRSRLGKQPLLILLDEFPVMLQTLIQKDPREARQLLAWLRIWRQTPGACRFVFTGSIGLQSLLERHGFADRMNDCFDFPLGPFQQAEARKMWAHFAQTHSELCWQVPEATLDHAMARIGWLSPYFLCLMLDATIRAARERRQECSPPSDVEPENILEIDDVDAAYENLLAARSRFIHWEKRLRDALLPEDLEFCFALLTALSRHEQGMTLSQLGSRLAKRETDAQCRAQRLQDLLVRLTDEGYTSTPDANKRVQFLSFPLRDWWNRNHV
ncbi:ATP-binding protein [Ferribacterium limneticum]|uniref:hypothetical protein n=1 Tax=Ferribacterium limneticum TaxID=76259 RepID=UPI001CF95555|nr:hypothetical protein [Ferribacterium limneticum]UCV29711.1 ATP-binding protein [Ferribacterium limneticum]UCV33630.1 ATP-binding protein [Ferribacterium limneticum]